MINVGVIGGTGYTGVELLRLLAGHPQVEVVAINASRSSSLEYSSSRTNDIWSSGSLAMSVITTTLARAV